MILKNIYAQIGVAWLILAGLAACTVPYTPPTPEEVKENRISDGRRIVSECRVSECTLLRLDGAIVMDFTVLNDMPHVTKLMLSRTNFTDLSEISEMSQLKELHISRTDVADLSGLAAFPNLELLHASNLEKKPDYAPVYKMRGLRELSLDGRATDSLRYVRAMPKLKKLFILGDEIGDVAPLAGNRSIEHLSLPSRVPVDEAPILRMRNLRQLNAIGSGLSDEAVEQLENKGISLLLFDPIVVC